MAAVVTAAQATRCAPNAQEPVAGRNLACSYPVGPRLQARPVLGFRSMSLLTSAVAAVILDPAGRVLLCQQSQGHRLWGLPGGKIRNGESPLHAVVRDI